MSAFGKSSHSAGASKEWLPSDRFSLKRSFDLVELGWFQCLLSARSGRYPTGLTIRVCSAVPKLPSLSKSIAWEIPIPLDCQNEIA